MAEKKPQNVDRAVHLSARERRKRERKIWRIGFLLSVVAHILIFLIGPSASMPDSTFSAAGPRALDDQAAQGAMQTLALSSAPPDAAIPPPTPVPDVEIPPPEEIEVGPEAVPGVEIEEPEVPLPGVGSTDGTDAADDGDAGLPEATGAGDGGSADEGLFRVVPPVPRGVIFPPDPAADLRGTQVEVWIFVDAEGRVVADSIRVDPVSSDRRYNEELREVIVSWNFRPARRGEELVATWYNWSISY